MTDAERERLYGVLAERLAAIGDSYTTNKQDLHGKSTPANPRAKTTATDSYTSNDGKHLFKTKTCDKSSICRGSKQKVTGLTPCY